jgi:hypothetical protein
MRLKIIRQCDIKYIYDFTDKSLISVSTITTAVILYIYIYIVYMYIYLTAEGNCFKYIPKVLLLNL